MKRREGSQRERGEFIGIQARGEKKRKKKGRSKEKKRSGEGREWSEVKRNRVKRKGRV